MSTLIIKTIKKQKKLLESGLTFDRRLRAFCLNKLKNYIEEDINKIHKALNKDLGKSYDECFYSETGAVISIINSAIKHLLKSSNFSVTLKPYGVCYIKTGTLLPFFTPISELIYAVASGNTVVLEPCKKNTNTLKIITELLNKTFNNNYVYVIQNNFKIEDNESYFDFIKITDNTKSYDFVPKTEHHIRKSFFGTAIVEKNSNINNAVNRLVFKKSIDWGQTYDAPDYIFVEDCIINQFIDSFIAEIENQIGSDPIVDDEFGHIIDEENYERLLSLIADNDVIYGGAKNNKLLKIGPHIIKLSYDKSIKFDNVLGPISFIIPFSSVKDALFVLNKSPGNSLYIFSNTKKFPELIINNTNYNDYYINNTTKSIDINNSLNSYQHSVNIYY